MTTAVGVDAKADGSGTVRVAVALDADAARRVPNLAQDLEVDDLREAGWTITGPTREGDGQTWIRASKPFAAPEQAGRVLAEVSGTKGPFQSFTLRRSRSFLKTTTSFRGTVDLGAGLEGFGDDDLRQRLGGTSTGIDAAALERKIGEALDRVFRFRVVARLPGAVTSNAPTRADGGAAWQPKLGEKVVLEATAESWNTRTIAGLAVAGVALVALAVLALTRWRRPG